METAMEKIFVLFTEWIHWPLALAIILSSFLVKKLAKDKPMKIGDTWLIFIWSTVVAVLYGFVEYLGGTFEPANLSEYLITYLFATSFYDLILKAILKRFKPTNETEQ